MSDLTPSDFEGMRQVWPEPHLTQFAWGYTEAPGGERFLTLTLFHFAGETTVFFTTDPPDGSPDPAAARAFLMAGLDALDALNAKPQGLHVPIRPEDN